MYMLSVTDFDSFIDPYKYQIDLYNEPRSSVFLAGQASHWPAGCLARQKLNFGHYMQNFQPVVLIPAMLIGTIDCCHFIPFSLALILPWGHKVSSKQNLLASFSHTLFNWSGLNFIWYWSNSRWTSWYYFWVKFIETREITAVLLTV